MLYLHDGAPAHIHRCVRDFLNEQLGDDWIEGNGPHPWPERSPDLNPLNFFGDI